jgi:beta-phosphoglucomutase-like phosphatase (HAD superfamily)
MKYALIFDCDGVFVNSEHIAQELERARPASFGMRYEARSSCAAFQGSTSPHTERY